MQLTLNGVGKKTVLETARKAKEITEYFQTRLIITDHYKVAAEIKADGVYLVSSEVCPTVVRKELTSWQIIGASAHTLNDCETLIEKNVNYIALGPFQRLNSEAGLDEKEYLTIMRKLKTNIPIIATGSIVLNDVLDVMITGVHGIAVSEEITRNFNSILKFKELINGGTTHEQRWEPGKPKN